MKKIDFADIFPTVCEMANVTIPSNINVDGQSFYGSITGKSQHQRKWASGAINRDFIVFDGQWRLHLRDNKLVDCRQLPDEKTITSATTPEEQQAMKSLFPIR
ncbi:MAG: hypothetical protein AAF705_05965 [Bacteroidota bacterium]